MKVLLLCATIFFLVSCAEFSEAARAGGAVIADRAPAVVDALATSPGLGIYSAISTLVAAGVAGYAAYERKRRKKAE